MRSCLRQADFTAGCGKHRRRITLFNRGARPLFIKCLLGLYPLKSGSISYDKVFMSASETATAQQYFRDAARVWAIPPDGCGNIGFDDADSVHPENFSLENWFLEEKNMAGRSCLADNGSA